MFPSLTVEYRFSDNIFDAITFTEELEGSVDCILFSSRATYLLVKDCLSLTVDCYFIPLKGNGLYKALFELTTKASIQHISIDGVAEEYINPIVENIEDLSIIYVNISSHVQQVEELCQEHEKNYQAYKKLGVITSLKLIADNLLMAGVPVVWLQPTKEDVIVCLERMLLSMTKRREKDHQIVFGKIALQSFSDNPPTNQENLLQKYKIEKLISRFVDEMNGLLLPNNGDEYLFITHRGEFERATEGYKNITLYSDMKNLQNFTLQIGIGFGWTTFLAYYHAELALAQAKQRKGNHSFIVNEERAVIGPVEIATPLIYKLEGEPHLAGVRKNEVMKAYLKKNRLTHFTAQEVAATFNVTNRTANRLIASWLDTGLIEVKGTEKVEKRGRPRQRYVFKEVAE